MTHEELKKVIEFAIGTEVDAYEFYKDAAEKVKDDYLKEVFQDLAKEELDHEVFLKEFLASGSLKIEVDSQADYKIDQTLDRPVLSVEMGFQDAISLAIAREKDAMDMYANLADACMDKEQEKLFLGLVEMERLHKVRLEEIYINIAYAEAW